MKTTRFFSLLLLAAIGLTVSLPAAAKNLLELYQAAKSFDASYQAAKAQYTASLAKGEQAKAALWPSVNLSAGVNRFNNSSDLPNSQRNSGNQDLTLNLAQPLYRPANLASAEQGKKQIALAQAQLDAATQDLMVRVTQAYFDVLAAQDTLDLVQAQQAALAEQLAWAKRNFEVGTASITDSREAQAKFDLVKAQEIAAANDLRVKRLQLGQLTGEPAAAPQPLLLALPQLPAIAPKDVASWVAQAQNQHPVVRQARIGLELAELETQKALAAGKPTLDLVASYSVAQGRGSDGFMASDRRTNTSSVGLSVKWPLFAGFAIQNRVKEALALEDKARFDLDSASRAASQATRAAFFGVESGQSQVDALQAAQASSQSALEAIKLGYKVGVRINMDVLNSESDLFDVKTKLAKARYEVLVGQIKLRQASGTLLEADLQSLNALLQK